MFDKQSGSVFERGLALVRILLPLARFDLFLQGTMLMLIFYDGVVYQLLKRSAAADLLPHNVHDWVFMGVGGAEVLFGSLIGWLGTSRKNYSLSIWLAAAGICGLLVTSVAQPSVQDPNVQLCGGGEIYEAQSSHWVTTENSSSWIRTALLVANLIFIALAKLACYALGITYLDSHDPANGPLYLGIQVTIRVSMSINAENWMRNPSFGDYWFRAQISMACLVIMFAILFCLFPVTMPGYKVPEIPQHGMGFLETVKRVVTNKTVMIQTVALALLNTAMWGYINHERSYAQSRYYMQAVRGWGDGWTSRVTADFLRTFIIVYCMGVFRARFSGRRGNGVKATTAAKVAGFIAIIAGVFYIVMALLYCNAAPVAGLVDDEYTQPACSSSCGCQSESYGFAPVCNIDDRETYFSPCHAGCANVEDYNGVFIFSNCTCGSPRVISAACDVSRCHGVFAIYQILFINALALSGGALLMQTMVILRSVDTHDQPTAVGTSLAIVALLAYLPGHYLYMFISDSTCAWKQDGACMMHGKSAAPILAGVTGGLILTSAVLSIVAFLVQRRTATTVL